MAVSTFKVLDTSYYCELQGNVEQEEKFIRYSRNQSLDYEIFSSHFENGDEGILG